MIKGEDRKSFAHDRDIRYQFLSARAGILSVPMLVIKDIVKPNYNRAPPAKMPRPRW